MVEVLQQVLDSGGSSGADQTGDEDVVTVAFDIQTRLDRVDRALLTDNPATWLDVVGCRDPGRLPTDGTAPRASRFER